VTGFDILFFWVARMMMMGLKFMNDVPFKDVYIHALVRDEFGKKMSKSLGNVIDPLMVMDKFGTDAFRFTLAALAAQGRDIRLSESRIEGYRNFMNKIWNAARFALPYVENVPLEGIEKAGLTLQDRWILSRLNTVIAQVRNAIEEYRFNDAAQALYHFTWHEFCDWYIEEAKLPLSAPDTPEARNTAATLRHVLEAIMALLHPFIPFITEEIASKIRPERETVMSGPFPVADPAFDDPSAEQEMTLLMGIISAIRTIRSEMNIPPSKGLPVNIFPSAAAEEDLVVRNDALLKSLGKITELIVKAGESEQPRMSAAAVVGEVKIYVPLEGIIDPDAEIARLTKELTKVNKDLEAVNKKLGNPDFMAKAGGDAVEKQQTRHGELTAKADGLGGALQKMRELKG
jgi:valyl-tRNA synthetase